MPKTPRQRQTEALARRERDLAKWTQAGNKDKADKAAADVLHLKRALGMAS